MKTYGHEIQLRTAGGLTVTDITDEVHEAVRESGVENGIWGLQTFTDMHLVSRPA